MVYRCIRFSSSQKDLLESALKIREEVFILEQNVDPELEHDEHDKTACHYLLYHNNEAIATGRWRKTHNGIKLERFAVLFKYRKKGAASYLLEYVLNDLAGEETSVYMHAQDHALDFYQKRGFVISGDTFYEANILHYPMVLDRK